MSHEDSSPPQPLTGRLRRRLDNLGVKLFLAIAIANLVLVVAVYLIYSWSFEREFVDYVRKSEEVRLDPMITSLADGYRQHGSWEWLEQDREEWGAMVGQVFGWRARIFSRDERNQPRGEQGQPSQDDRSAPREPRNFPRDGNFPRQENPVVQPITFDWRLMLMDADSKVVIPVPRSDAAMIAQAVKLPIMVDDSTVGYLGYIPRLQQVQTLESYFAKQQSWSYGVIALGMLAAVLLNAALISHWLSRRLRALGHGATALARGDYATRIPARGHDELARLAGDFNHLAQALEAAQRGRQQWIADIAHELRTPLTSLRAEVEAMQDGVRPLTQGSMASVAQEVHQLTRLVEDLRLLSLSDLGALTCRKERADLTEIIEDALAAGHSAIEEKGVQVQTHLDQSIVVNADSDRLAQVFGNLLQNTLRYTESPGRLVIRAVSEGVNARIDWEDSPPGVGDQDLHRLTDRLYRVDESRARMSGGSGLGLAIVKAIIDAHGGRMQASHSSLGGLCWSIWLPLS
ncbi:MAG: ATP-binding protein [Steroidobacteraceae bacterium]